MPVLFSIYGHTNNSLITSEKNAWCNLITETNIERETLTFDYSISFLNVIAMTAAYHELLIYLIKSYAHTHTGTYILTYREVHTAAKRDLVCG